MTVLAFSLFLLFVIYEVSSQETFDKQAEREKLFEGKSDDDAQGEESKRSPTGKFLLLKGEIRDDDDSKSDLSLLDRLMPSKTKVIIDGGAAFPFPPPPPPPPPMLPPQFLLPPPPHGFIPSVIIGPTGDFGPLPPLGPQIEQKLEEENANSNNNPAEQQNVVVGDADQQRPAFENVRPPLNDAPMMQQDANTQRFQNMMGDGQGQQSDWSPSRFRMMQENGEPQQQESAQRFQGMLPLDMQQQEQSSSHRLFGASQPDPQQEGPQHFQGGMESMGENNNMQQSNSDSQQESSWSPQRFQGHFNGEQEQQGGQQRPGADFGSDMMPGKAHQMSSFQQFENQPSPMGKPNRKNKDKGKNGQKSGSNILDLKPEPEPPGCSCGPMFKQAGWGHSKRCAKRCAGHHHHHSIARASYSAMFG